MVRNLKKSWDDVTIGMWQELSLIDTQSEITRFIEQISILTDADPEEIRRMSMTDFSKFRTEVAFIETSPTPDVKIKFEIDGKKYGMIPQLDFITAGEWIDAETWKDDSVANIHLYAALLYRPITKEEGESYEIEPHKPGGFMERSELFRDKLSITIIHGAVLFFSSIAIDFTRILADYSASQVKGIVKTTKTTQTQTATKKRKPKRSKSSGESMI
jgi:hypothetical protein